MPIDNLREKLVLAEQALTRIRDGAPDDDRQGMARVTLSAMAAVAQVAPRPRDERNGCFLDSMWCCKVCDGEIPDGHTNDCDIWKLEKKHRDFIANEYSAVLIERDRLRAALETRS